MGDRGTDDDGEGSVLHSGSCLRGGVNPPFDDEWDLRDTGDLVDELEVGAVGLGTLPGVAGQGGPQDVDPGILSGPGVIQGPAVGHDEDLRTGLTETLDGLSQAQFVGTGAAGTVQRHDLAPGGGHGNGVSECRGDEDAVVTVLPQADDGDVDVLADEGQIRQSLCADTDAPPATQACATSSMVRGSRIGSPG